MFPVRFELNVYKYDLEDIRASVVLNYKNLVTDARLIL
jgi:hypothetical protein